MTLCALCDNITIDTIATAYPTDSSKYGEPAGYAHQLDWDSLLASSKTCEFCQLIKEVGETDGGLPTFDPQFDEVPDQIARRNASQRLKIRAFRPGTSVSDFESAGLSSLSIRNAQRLSLHVDIFADEDSEAARSGIVAGRPINENSGSTQTFDLVRSWMRKCHDSHHMCSLDLGTNPAASQTENGPILPTRVLDVDLTANGEVRLYVTNGAKGKYAALSHRWGKRENTALTTTDNLTNRQSGILIKSLSALFQDAIEVTRRLNLQYLWIDSLCILQDSHEDWKQESARMGDVFGHSEITISAAVSEDGESGFLGARRLDAVRLNYRKSSNEPRMGFIYARRPKNRLDLEIRESLLNTRAWVFQERILAPRVLTFAKSQVFWECREMLAGEGGPQAGSTNHSLRKITSTLLDIQAQTGDHALKIQIYSAWRNFVHVISDAGLTYEADRLHTILGLATQIQKVTGSKYLYGTWIEDLALELSWDVQPKNRNMFTCKRPSRHRAPTWCWSSLEGPINFKFNDLNDHNVCFEYVPNISRPLLSPIPPRHDALYLSAHARTCEVTSNGVSWSNGNIPETVTDEDHSWWVRCTKAGGLATLADTGEVIGGARFDLRPTFASMDKFTCLLLITIRSSSKDENESKSLEESFGSGLLLSATGVKDTFSRVGSVNFSPAGIAWLRGVEKRVLTLV